jgi:ketosteroid isomerase-like protein
MSERNLETVRRLYEAWMRDGFGPVPDLMDPEIEWVNPPYAVEPGTRRGYAGFAAASDAFGAVYRDSRISDPKIYEAGERIAVTARMSTRSVGDVPLEAERGYVFDLRDGKVVRFSWFVDPAEALAAVGIKP